MAVHGLGAHPLDTWTQEVSPHQFVNWLIDKHMLPHGLPCTRIMTYGYQSQWFGKDTVRRKASDIAKNLLIDLSVKRKVDTFPVKRFLPSLELTMVQSCGERPLIFIAHSFGGIVVVKVDQHDLILIADY